MLSLLFAPSTSGAPRTGTGSLWTLVAAVGQSIHRWHRRRVTARRLQELDDRTLHDIGLSRDEIDSVVHTGGRGRSPRFVDFELYRHGR